uniref:Uncharacterized protein n=1 Tax=Chenopodium quinoa TaxID=63459 RepID=A0A803LS33_CHEQI
MAMGFDSSRCFNFIGFGDAVAKVSSARHEILFETIQTLPDFIFILTRAYVSGEDGCFMDVFHVMDVYVQKIQGEGLIDHLCHARF